MVISKARMADTFVNVSFGMSVLDSATFYYADYNFAGSMLYSNHRFPCCSGTLPQVAVD